MKTQLSLDDLALFAQVARLGSLTETAHRNHISVATLSRRMRAMETQCGRALFLHGGAGYRLTAAGQELYDRTRAMEDAAAEIARWERRDIQQTPVRITAGMWTSLYLVRNIEAWWSPNAIWVPEFVGSNLKLDIARREVDVGIRNRAPDQPWLAGRRLRWVQFAAFGTDPNQTGWIGLTGEAAMTKSSRWLDEHHSQDIVTRANSQQIALALAAQGVGKIILPIGAAQSVTDLPMIGEPIPGLGNEEWLVCHQDTRHDRPVRQAIDALTAFLAEETI